MTETIHGSPYWKATAKSLKESILENSNRKIVSDDRAEELAIRYCAFRSRDWDLDIVIEELLEATEAESIEELAEFKGIDKRDLND